MVTSGRAHFILAKLQLFQKKIPMNSSTTSVKYFYWSAKKVILLITECVWNKLKCICAMKMLGNNKDGLSVGKAISSGCKAADLVISYLNLSTDAMGSSC